MKIPGLRHSAEQVGGIVFFGRMLDKIRLHTQGKLPPDYKRGTGTDARVCRFLGVEYPALVERVLAGGTALSIGYSLKSVSGSFKSSSLIQALRKRTSWPSH